MKEKKRAAELISSDINSGLSNSLIEVMSKLERINERLMGIHEIEKVAERVQTIIEPMNKLQHQLDSYSSIYKAMNYPAITSHQTEVLKQVSRLQVVPFDRIATILNAAFEKLRFREFDLFDNIEESEEENSTIIISEINDIKKIILEIYRDNQFLYQISSRKFEEVIAELLLGKGFEVELTKQTRDNGYDIIALKNINGFANKYLIECKRHAPTRPIGINIIRSFCDVIKEEKANKGIIFTTSYFSKPSVNRKNYEGHILDFKNRDDIIEWVKDYLKI